MNNNKSLLIDYYNKQLFDTLSFVLVMCSFLFINFFLFYTRKGKEEICKFFSRIIYNIVWTRFEDIDQTFKIISFDVKKKLLHNLIPMSLLLEQENINRRLMKRYFL